MTWDEYEFEMAILRLELQAADAMQRLTQLRIEALQKAMNPLTEMPPEPKAEEKPA